MASFESSRQGSIEELCEGDPQRIRDLFEHIDLALPGLEAVRAEVAVGRWTQACHALLDYYRNAPSGQWLRREEVEAGDGTDPEGEKIVDGFFPLAEADIQLPRLDSGGWDWAWKPDCEGAGEWTEIVVGHHYFSALLTAFFNTGNRRYVRALDEFLLDWTCCVAPMPPTGLPVYPWGTRLSVGHRAKVWPAVFYGLQREPGFRPATRLLLLSQAFEHADYLRLHHGSGSNWVITEMSGLLSMACAWPEFKEAAGWREYALRVVQEELNGQVYPDGAFKELTCNYQYAVLVHTGFMIETLRGAGFAVPPELGALLEKMWSYLAYTLDSRGMPPNNNDSDRYSLAQPILRAAEMYGRADWTYIASNGERGERPAGLPSLVFPWAGQLVMRDAWDGGAHWAFFDFGPWGTLHQHNDAMHLSVGVHGRDVLVDSGRYTYTNYDGEPCTWRNYFIGSQSHNVVLIDGRGQKKGAKVTDVPAGPELAVAQSDYAYAQGNFTGGFVDCNDQVEHSRAVLYISGLCWIVVDRIRAESSHRITSLWHFHPDCSVARDGRSVQTIDSEQGNLRVQPIGPLNWEIEFVRGREGPEFQGWFSSEMGVKNPATCVCYSAHILGTTTMAWLLLPGLGEVPAIKVDRFEARADAVHFRLNVAGAGPLEVAIRLETDMPPGVSNGQTLSGHCEVLKGRQ